MLPCMPHLAHIAGHDEVPDQDAGGLHCRAQRMQRVVTRRPAFASLHLRASFCGMHATAAYGRAFSRTCLMDAALVRLQQVEAGEHGLRERVALVPGSLRSKQAVCYSQGVRGREAARRHGLRQGPACEWPALLLSAC